MVSGFILKNEVFLGAAQCFLGFNRSGKNIIGLLYLLPGVLINYENACL